MPWTENPCPVGIGSGICDEWDDGLKSLAQPTLINTITFTGLLTGTNPGINQIVVEMYRVFPADSDTGRTSGPPTFSTALVPTRVNSPSDVAFASRDSTVSGDLTFTTLREKGRAESTLPFVFSPLQGKWAGKRNPACLFRRRHGADLADDHSGHRHLRGVVDAGAPVMTSPVVSNESFDKGSRI
ncbi:MAG TPA: hypothetical protein VFG28_06985, partial [Syntrophales bacterium]|nr:hypothetical protein [Syntrophales bacterium]